MGKNLIVPGIEINHLNSLTLFESLCNHAYLPVQFARLIRLYSGFRTHFSDPQFSQHLIDAFDNSVLFDFLLTQNLKGTDYWNSFLWAAGQLEQTFSYDAEHLLDLMDHDETEKQQQTVKALLELMKCLPGRDDLDSSIEYVCLEAFVLDILPEWDSTTLKILDLEFEIMKYFSKNDDSPLSAKDLMTKVIVEKIDKFQPDIVGISVIFSISHNNTCAIANIVKEKNAIIQVVCGGNHATFAYERILKECKNIDYIFLYEVDNSFPLFLKYQKGIIEFRDLKGIAWSRKTAYLLFTMLELFFLFFKNRS